MNSILSGKATVSAMGNSVTVYGQTAKVVNAISITAVLLIAIALIIKAYN